MDENLIIFVTTMTFFVVEIIYFAKCTKMPMCRDLNLRLMIKVRVCKGVGQE
jgi:hypothetical protein